MKAQYRILYPSHQSRPTSFAQAMSYAQQLLAAGDYQKLRLENAKTGRVQLISI